MQDNPKNTIYAAKRLIGRVESDALAKDIGHLQWDLDVIYNDAGVPLFKGKCLIVTCYVSLRIITRHFRA